jgi:hypothetical protein
MDVVIPFGATIFVLAFLGIAWLFRRTVRTKDDQDISRPL